MFRFFSFIFKVLVFFKQRLRFESRNRELRIIKKNFLIKSLIFYLYLKSKAEVNIYKERDEVVSLFLYRKVVARI